MSEIRLQYTPIPKPTMTATWAVADAVWRHLKAGEKIPAVKALYEPFPFVSLMAAKRIIDEVIELRDDEDDVTERAFAYLHGAVDALALVALHPKRR